MSPGILDIASSMSLERGIPNPSPRPHGESYEDGSVTIILLICACSRQQGEQPQILFPCPDECRTGIQHKKKVKSRTMYWETTIPADALGLGDVSFTTSGDHERRKQVEDHDRSALLTKNAAYCAPSFDVTETEPAKRQDCHLPEPLGCLGCPDRKTLCSQPGEFASESARLG